MAKFRIVDTRFWSDTYIADLDPLEKLLFLYFITNQYTNLSGVYEIPLKQIALDTGIDKENLEKVLLPRFKKSGKIYYFDGWVYVKNFQKHQKASGNIQAGIQNALKEIPNDILSKINKIDSQRGVRGVSEGGRVAEYELESELEPKGGDKPPTPQSPSPIKEIEAYFTSRVKEELGFEPEINFKKVGGLLKNLSKRYSKDQLKRLVDYYLCSKKCRELGADLAICLSSNTINLWLQDEGAEE